MTETRIDITNGGRVVIVGGMNKSWETFRKFPQFEFWTGDQKDIKRAVHDRDFPPNTRGLIISRFISHSELTHVLERARKRQIPVIANKPDGEIAVILDDMTKDFPWVARETPTNEQQEVMTKVQQEEDTSQSKGKLTPLLQFIDFSLSNIENARILMKKAEELGIKSTEASLAQLVAVHRKKQSGGTVPKSVRPKLDTMVEMFDTLIQDMTSYRDFVIDTVEENRILKTKLARYKKVLSELDD